MRGKVGRTLYLVAGERITPAYAGKSTDKAIKYLAKKDHPRVCGEKDYDHSGHQYREGSPPHVRGKVAHSPFLAFASGITPACAGKSVPTTAATPCTWDHPRMCGEKTGLIRIGWWTQGSPPHVRGKGTFQILHYLFVRITPACAGKRPA